MDDFKFTLFVDNLFLALDEDEKDQLPVENVIIFVKDFMKGTQYPNTKNTSFEDANNEVMNLLYDSDQNYMNREDLAKFFRELLKS